MKGIIQVYFLVLRCFISFDLGKNGAAPGYSTWDPRKQQQGEQPYQEIPYGDGPGPRGPIPDVPQHYAQVPPVPQRQGWFYFHYSLVLCSFVQEEVSPLYFKCPLN